MIAVGSALALATAPAFATVAATTDSIDTVTINSDLDPDSISVSCLASQAAVNGSPALPALACGVVKHVVLFDIGGSDTIDLSNATTAFPAVVNVDINSDDGGADIVTGSAGRDAIVADFLDTVNAGTGNDRVDGGGTVNGGDGDDLLAAPDGSAQGGPGNDRITGITGGPIDGGTGNDIAEFDFSDTTTDVPITEVLTDSGLTISAPMITPITVGLTNLEQFVITMADGASNDNMDSHTYSGRLTFRGLGGDDTFLGGAGPDFVDAGLGNDSLTPGAGSDTIHAGEGNDVINVQDGAIDIVECGAGTDSVTADRSDALSNCENVSLPPLPAPETGKVAGPKKVTKGEKATFTFSSSTAGATFECQVDKGAFTACASPFKVKTKKLKAGKHTLSVRAVQPAGNADATPSTFKFKVTAKK
jgi:Ca2+-binding RTX toxin-like protein